MALLTVNDTGVHAKTLRSYRDASLEKQNLFPRILDWVLKNRAKHTNVSSQIGVQNDFQKYYQSLAQLSGIMQP